MLLRKSISFVATIGGLCVAPFAWSQSHGGAYVDGGLGMNIAQADVEETDPPDSLKRDVGKPNFAVRLGAGWRHDAGNMVYGVGFMLDPLTYDVNKEDDSNPPSSSSAKTEMKNHWAIGVDIGWKLAPATVLYGKLSYNSAKVESQFSQVGPTLSYSWSNTHTGIGYGAGARHMLSRTQYVFVDWHYVKFDSKTTSPDPTNATLDVKTTPSLNTGSIGMGWKF